MHQAKRIDGMEEYSTHRTQILLLENVVVAGVGVRYALTAGRYVIEATFVQRLQKDQESAGRGRLKRIDQLIRRTTCPAAMTSWTWTTTIGIMAIGLAMQVTSAIMPIFITCDSIGNLHGLPRPARSEQGCLQAA